MKFEQRPSRYPVIDPKDYGIDLLHDEPIAESESRVFPGLKTNGNRCILKIYDTKIKACLTVVDILAYQNITKLANAELSGQVDVVRVGRNSLSAEWRVVPIDEVGILPRNYSPRETPCSVCKEKTGQSLLDVINGESLSSEIASYQFLIDQQERIYSFLGRIDRQLNKSLGIKAVLIEPWNIKVSPQKDTLKGLILTITDVCGWVSSLKA